MYDVVIQNGKIIDHAQGIIGQKQDIFIRNGIFVEPDHDGTTFHTRHLLDASECIVTPGLVDVHFHAFEGGNYIGAIYPDIICPPNGITTVVDAGTAGTLNFKALYNDCVTRSRTEVKALLHPTAFGVLWPAMDEPENPDEFDIPQIRTLFEEYKNTLVGLKIRCNAECTIGFGTSPIKKTVEIANQLNNDGHHCVVTMHFGQVEQNVSVDDMADCLRAGDIFAHFYQPCQDQTFDKLGKMRDGILRAKERGVLFDACMASSHYSFKNIRTIMQTGFMPDIISSDMVSKIAYYKPCFSLPFLLSLFLEEGMPLEEIIKAVTYTPAKAFGLLGPAGTLKTGTRADVSIFKIKEQNVQINDSYGGVSNIGNLIVPMATVRNGAVLFQQLFLN